MRHYRCRQNLSSPWTQFSWKLGSHAEVIQSTDCNMCFQFILGPLRAGREPPEMQEWRILQSEGTYKDHPGQPMRLYAVIFFHLHTPDDSKTDDWVRMVFFPLHSTVCTSQDRSPWVHMCKFIYTTTCSFTIKINASTSIWTQFPIQHSHGIKSNHAPAAFILHRSISLSSADLLSFCLSMNNNNKKNPTKKPAGSRDIQDRR